MNIIIQKFSPFISGQLLTTTFLLFTNRLEIIHLALDMAKYLFTSSKWYFLVSNKKLL